MLILSRFVFYTIFAHSKSSYETGKSVTGGKGENPEKTTWHTHKHDLVCVTCDCRLVNWAATYGEVIGCCQSDIACFNQFTSFYHMLCDVASIFAVRTFVV